MMGVWNETQYVLKRQPGHPRALSYQALVRLAMGQGELAESMLKQALAGAPDMLDGYLHLALVYVRIGRAQDADATIAEAQRRFPAQAEMLKGLMAEMRQTVADAPLEGDPHASVAPPAGTDRGGAGREPPPARQAGAPEGAPPAAAGGAAGVSGVVELDPSLKGQPAPGAILFVMVREAGFGAGPPAAAKRLAVSGFPVRFELGAADSMMGQPLPASMLVEARLDGDGDPTTRSPEDPKARVDDVKAGTSGLRLVLKR